MEAIHSSDQIVDEPMPNKTTRFWPEPWREQQRERPFPLTTLLTWILPGLFATVLLMALFAYLFAQANKRIVHIAPTGELAAIRANGNPANDMGGGWLRLSASGQQNLLNQTGIPALGYPQASPDARWLAVTLENGNATEVSLFSAITDTVITLPSNNIAVPNNGWSADSTRLALIDYDGTKPILSILDVTNEDPAPKRLTSRALDIRVGLAWHPTETQLLATQINASGNASLVRIGSNSQATEFRPNDGESERADAVWSPDGSQIAYIGVQNQLIIDGHSVLAGTLWLANSDGTNVRTLVPGISNTAPVWLRQDPSHIYFVQEMTNTLSFQRVTIAQPNVVETIGEVPADFLAYPFDRQLFLQAGLDNTPPFQLTADLQDPSLSQNFKPNHLLRLLLRHELPLLGSPVWSPDGSRLAATVWHEGKIQTAVYNNNLQSPHIIQSPKSEIIAVPSDGWSANGTHLALLEKFGGRPVITISTNESTSVPFDFTVDTRAGLSWNSATDELLITAVSSDTNSPILRTALPDGTNREFARNDGQTMRADAAWSPNGQKVVYVASTTYTTTQDILFGNLWLADSTGTNTTQITRIGNAFAPVWAPNGDAIFFTRLDPASGQFELYRLPFLEDGSLGKEHHIGPSSEAFLQYPFDRSQLLQWSPNGAELLLIGGEHLPPPGFQPQLDLTNQIQAKLPLVGASRWSANRQYFAASQQLADGKIGTILYDTTSGTDPITTASDTYPITVVPADGWSPFGTQIALIRQKQSGEVQLGFLNPANRAIGTANIVLDTRAGISWEPNERFVLVTALHEEITPTLYAVNPSGNISSSPFIPDDELPIHGDAAWSPDGEQVAYIATDNIQDSEHLTGSLWLANADGRQSRVVVEDGLNFAPIWISNNELYFTRLITETINSYQLYHLELDGTDSKIEHMGPSTAAFANFPFDRQLFMTWTENGRFWNLNNQPERQQQIIYRADAAGQNLAPLDETAQCPLSTLPFSVRWASTSRAVLVACPTGSMQLHWLDSSRENEIYARGIFPTWEP